MAIIKEEACMKYLNAMDVLPDALVKELQEYLQGGYLYIPAKKGHYRCWGELSGARKEIDARNREIIQKYYSGISIEQLAKEYFLSEYAIRKIIYYH